MIQYCIPSNVGKKQVEPRPKKPQYASKRHIKRKVPQPVRKAIIILTFNSPTNFTVVVRKAT